MPPRAQLAVRRDHVALWYRRAAGELWTLEPSGARQVVPRQAWLVASATGDLEVATAPQGGALAALRHPRSGHWQWITAEGLGGEGWRGAAGVEAPTALAWSWDGQRLYVATTGGSLWSLPVASSEPAELVAELAEPATEPVGLAVGPAGLVVTTGSAVWGVNVRQRRAARLLSWPSLLVEVGLGPSPALGGLSAMPDGSAVAPAVAVDARGWLYLADEAWVLRVRADGSGLALVAHAEA